jgi:Tol biopolymer transport system component
LDNGSLYIGQSSPDLVPEIFAENIVSTPKDEINAVFSPDGKEFYFSRDTYKNKSSAGRDYTIMYLKHTDNGWSKPQETSFSKEYMNADMFITHDNRYLFFCSDRPKGSSLVREDNSNIWYVKRIQGGWSEPIYAGDLLNTPNDEWYPSITQNNLIYFSSNRNPDTQSDIYKITFDDSEFINLENVGSPINTKFRENDVFISKDESYMIVSSSDRQDGLGSGDLYISFKQSDGSWTKLKNMAAPINSEELEYCPIVSPDGKYLFFSSRRRGNDDIYWVSSEIIELLR